MCSATRTVLRSGGPRPGRTPRRARLAEVHSACADMPMTIRQSVRIAASKNVPEASCRCLTHLFLDVFARIGSRFGGFRMTSDARSLQIAQRGRGHLSSSGARPHWGRTPVIWPCLPARFSRGAAPCGSARPGRQQNATQKTVYAPSPSH